MISGLSQDAARDKAEAWLKLAGKADDGYRKAFDAIWQNDKPLLDKVTDTFALGDEAAAKLLAEVRDSEFRPRLPYPS